MKLGKALLLASGCGLLTACNDPAFRGNNDKNKPPITLNPAGSEDSIPHGSKVLSITCDPSAPAVTTAPVSVDAPGRENLVIEGEVCPRGYGELTVLFVVDFSESMLRLKGRSGEWIDGNDLMKNGSCGRLKAAQAIYDAIKGRRLEEDNVKIGILPFSSKVVEQKIIIPKDFSRFSQHLDAASFCGAEGLTNYKSALDGAAEILRNIKGNKAVYFITDGLPTAILNADGTPEKSVDDAALLGKRAADRIRESIEQLALSAVFLGSAEEVANFDPKAYLESITGDANRVRFVDRSEDLASEVTKLGIPSIDVQSDSAVATLEIPGAAPIKLKITSIKKTPGKDGTYTFTTEPFTIAGAATTANFSFSIKAANGQEQKVSAQVTIKR